MSDIFTSIKYYLPDIIHQIREYQEIEKKYDHNIVTAISQLNRIEQNRFLDGLDEYGCERNEQILGIIPDPSDTLEDRRRRIRGYYTSNKPYTIKKLREVLGAMCGENGYILTVDTENYIVKVAIKLESRRLVNNADELVRRMIPANLIVDVYLLYNQNISFKKYTHGELKKYTHYQLRNNLEFQEGMRNESKYKL